MSVIKFSNKYAERLYNEWITHGKIIIGTDFDSTISPYGVIENLQDIEDCKQLLRDCKLVGCYIVVHTACNVDRYENIKQYCAEQGIIVDTINETPIPELPFGKNGSKPYCNIFLDDRAGFIQALEILEEVMYKVRSYKAGKKLDNPGSTEF